MPWPAARQHVGIGSVTLVFPLLVAKAAGADPRTVTRHIALSMVALGVATLRQAWGRRGIGSGVLLPACSRRSASRRRRRPAGWARRWG